MKQLVLAPVSRIDGSVTLPGSKSLSNRLLLLSALAEGETTLTNLLASDDTERMLTALRALGTTLDVSADGTSCRLTGHAGPFPHEGTLDLDLGNAGTAIRPLCAALCLSDGTVTLTGDSQMQERPIEDLVSALRQAGADITYGANEGYPPVILNGGGLTGGEISISGGVSSQYLTSLLMTLPLAPADSVIHVIGEQVSKPYLDITAHTMSRFGVDVALGDYQRVEISGGRRYRSPGAVLVEGDASSATYFLAAAAIKGGTVRVHGIGEESVQGDVQFVDVLERMGARVTRSRNWIAVTRGDLNAVDLDLNHIPDAAMTVATTALFADGTTRIRNIYNWQVKETNRLDAMARELSKLGASVETGEDYIAITPPPSLRAAAIDTYNDHRMAMSFSLAALGDAEVTINDPDCTAKTFPGYFDEFKRIAVAP